MRVHLERNSEEARISTCPSALYEELPTNAIDLLKANHERVKPLLTQLSESTERGVKKRTEPSTTEFSGRVNVMKELLEHPIEEAQTEMFPRLKNYSATQRLKPWVPR